MMIIVAPLGLIFIILVVILVVVVVRSAERPTEAEEIEAKNWAFAQADIKDARERYRLDPSEQNRQAVEEARGRAAANSTAAEETVAPAVSDPIDQIKRLAELRDQGIVSEEEFVQKKAMLLQRVT